MKNPNNSDDIVIRPISPADHDAIKAIARRSFSVIQSSIVKPSSGGLVATIHGQVVTAVLVHVLDLPKQGQIGRIGFLFTDPDHRGLDLARRLVKQGVEYLNSLECTTVVAEVEGHNTPSANIFHELGFRRLSNMAQVDWLSAMVAVVLGLHTIRLFTPGHFLWALDVPGQPAPAASPKLGSRSWGQVLNYYLFQLFDWARSIRKYNRIFKPSILIGSAG